MNEGRRRDNQSAPRSIAKCPRCASRMPANPREALSGTRTLDPLLTISAQTVAAGFG
jgi:hypothetical protein